MLAYLQSLMSVQKGSKMSNYYQMPNNWTGCNKSTCKSQRAECLTFLIRVQGGIRVWGIFYLNCYYIKGNSTMLCMFC